MEVYSPSSNSRGFTLVELVTVIVLLAIVSSVAVARFSDVTSFHERGFFDELQGALRYGQKLAVATGCEVRVELDTSVPVGYALFQRATDCTSGSFIRPVIHASKGGPFAAAAPQGVTLSADQTTVTFDAMGRAVIPGGAEQLDVAVGAFTLRVVGESGYVYPL